MDDSLGKIFSVIVGCFLLFIYPTLIMFDNQDNITQVFVLNEVTRLVEEVKIRGEITQRMHQRFIEQLSATGNSYSIEYKHLRYRVNPQSDGGTIKNNMKINYSRVESNQIRRCLEQDRRYPFNKNDYFEVVVKNDQKTVATQLKEWIYHIELPQNRIFVKYGGMIKNEIN